MPYNPGMNQLTLVLPFALPPPEMASDLLRALQAPALAALLSRTTREKFETFDNSIRILPHEAWLAHALGLAAVPTSAATRAAFACAVMRGLGLAQPEGTWFIVNPVHIQIARNHLLMGEQRHLGLNEADSHALFTLAKPYFDEIGQPLLYGDAQTWFMRADDWAGLRTASPDAATGQNLHAWMPEGAGAPACRKLQNEVQMLWFEHPVNEARQARGLPAINSFWVWGGASATATTPVPALLACDAPPWLAALAAKGVPAGFSGIQAREHALVVLGTLTEAGLAADWSSWLMHMQQLERDWFLPVLAALKEGRLGQLTLVLSHRSAHAEFSSSKLAQRKFWRPINLNKLST